MNDLLPEGTVRRTLPPPVWMITCAFVAIVGIFLFHRRDTLSLLWMEDLHVYARAVRFFRSGTNPYYLDLSEGLRFVYPPIVLYAAGALAAIMPGESEWGLVAVIHLICVLLAPFVLARFYLRAHWFTPAMALLAFFWESRFTGILALYSANVAPSLYLAGLLAGIPGIRRNRWGWFYVVVLLAGAIKITFILMLLFPLLAGRRQWLRSIGTVAGVGAIYAAQSRLVPSLYAGYKWAVLKQVKVDHQYGFGIFGVVGWLDERLHRPLGLEAYAAHALVAGTILLMMFWLRSRRVDVREPSLWLGMLVMTVIIVNPRMLHYDAYLALFAAYFVLAVVLGLDRWKLIALMVAMFLPSVAVLHVVSSYRMWGCTELVIILIAIVAGLWKLVQVSRLVENEAEVYAPVESLP